MDFWPTGRGIHNWDAVGWAATGAWHELVLVEAKAHLGELKSSCTATAQRSIDAIEAAFGRAKAFLGVDAGRDWSKDYYQFANRLTTLYFLHTRGIKARLLFVYFVGDRSGPGRSCPADVAGWEAALRQQADSLGLPAQHPLRDRVHKLFLHAASAEHWC